MKAYNNLKYSSITFRYTFLILIIFCISACSGPRTEKIDRLDKDHHDSIKVSSGRIETKAEDDSNQKVKTILYSIYNEWKNTRYKKGGLNKNGIDCSGLVYEVFRTSFAQILPRSTFEQIKVGESIPKNSLSPGDLVFFKTGRSGRLHVGIYIEDKTFLHVSEKKGVILSDLDNIYWKKTYFKAKRIFGFL